MGNAPVNEGKAMAKEAEIGGGRRGRGWRKAAWVAVAALVLLPFLALWVVRF